MKKVFGIEAEVNITTDEEVIKGISKGLAKGTVTLEDLFKDIKPEIVKALKEALSPKEEKEKPSK